LGFFEDDFVELPLAEPDESDRFKVDRNVNVSTIDSYLGIPDVCYRDMRFLNDTAQWEKVGGDHELSFTIEGFEIVPYPLIATLKKLPVPGAYEGPKLFDVDWVDDGGPKSVTANYAESEQILNDLFPKDQPILMLCGGGGYSGMMRDFLEYMGWNPDDLYNVGAGWKYSGGHAVDLIETASDGSKSYKLWRACCAIINFDQLTPVR
jgi:hypothetical protein